MPKFSSCDIAVLSLVLVVASFDAAPLERDDASSGHSASVLKNIHYYDDMASTKTTAIAELLLAYSGALDASRIPMLARSSEPIMIHRHVSDHLKTGLEDVSCRLTLDFGREDETLMPSAWGASGYRLFLHLNLTFADKPLEGLYQSERRLGLREGMRQLIVNEEASFVSLKGDEHVKVSNGAWSVQPTNHPSGQMLLQFYLDLPSPIKCYDVEVPAERIFFSSAIWPKQSLLNVQSELAAEFSMVKLAKDLQSEFKLKNMKDDSARSPMQNVINFAADLKEYDNIVAKNSKLRMLLKGAPDHHGVVETPDGRHMVAKGGQVSMKRIEPAWQFLYLMAAETYPQLGNFTISAISNAV